MRPLDRSFTLYCRFTITEALSSKYYTPKLDHLIHLEANWTKRRDRLALSRLLVFFISLVLIYYAYSIDNLLGHLFLGSALIFFGYLIYLSKKYEDTIINIRCLKNVYQNELDILNGQENAFGNGLKYKDTKHPFSYDLDIFGTHSLYNIINRAITLEGKEILAQWLNKPEINPKTIIRRQDAIKELATKEALRDAFLSTNFKYTSTISDSIDKWISFYSSFFINRPLIKVTAIFLSLLTAAFAVIAVLFNKWVLMSILFINYLFVSYFNRNVDKLHVHISGNGDQFAMQVEAINKATQYDYKSTYLNDLISGNYGFAKIKYQLIILNRLVNQSDQRLNILVSLPLNLFFFWDIQLSYKIEHWLNKNKAQMHPRLQNLGEFDALISLGTLTFNYPQWVFPSVLSSDFSLSTTSIGHPLLAPTNCINNDYTFEGRGRLDIISGSNMSGKSTFLKTIGINLVLAQVGGPVCAKEFEFTPAHIYTSMKITDSIEDNLSTFHAELKRVENMLVALKEKTQCFFLLDELFRGTNSKDRHAGSTALIKHFIDEGASGIIATHDLELTELSSEYPEKIKNYYFDIEIKNNDLYFDYTLKKGVCDTFNAEFLLKKIGLDIK